MSVNVYNPITNELNPLTSAFANLPIIDVATLPSQYLVDAIYRVASDNWVFSSIELSASDMTVNVTNLEAIGFATNVDGDEYTFTPATANIRYLHNEGDYSISKITIDSVTGEMNIYNTALEPLFVGVISSGALYPFYYSEKWSTVNILLSHTDMDANTEAFTNNGFSSSTDNVHYTYIPAAKRFRYDGHQISKIIVTSTDGNMKMYDEQDTVIYDAVIVDGAYTFTSASAVTYWVGNKAKQTADQLAKIDDIRSFNSVSSLQDIFNSNPAQVVSGNSNNMMFVDDSGNKYIGVSKDGVHLHNTNQNVNLTPADIEVSHQASGSKVTDFKVNATKITLSDILKEALKTDLDIYDVEEIVTGVETDATSASKAYVVGDLLILGDVLYKVKAAIAASDPLTVGTNIEAITVEEWVNELLGDRDDVIEQIEKDIAVLENGATASKAFAVNDLLIREDVLYKVTSAIAIGDTFTVGTNIAVVTIEDLLKLKQNKTLDTPLAIDSTTTNATTVEGALGLLNQKKLNVSLKGAAEGLAELNANGKVPASQLPSYVDDVIEGYYNEADGKFYETLTVDYDPVTPAGTEDPSEEGWYEYDGTDYIPTTDTTVDPSKTYYEEVWTYDDEITGETGKIYIDLSTEKSYRWSGTVFVNIGSSLALGETAETAYRGDRGKIAYDDSQTNKAAIASILADIASVDEETATAAHAIDDLILVDNQLYKVTTAIAIGDTIAAGTNVTAVTLEEALQNKLDSWSALPTASATYLGKIVHYKGADTSTLVQGYIYKCVSETDETTGDVTYKWQPTINIVIDDELDDDSVNPVQNKVVKEAIDKKQDYIFCGTHDEWEALTAEQKEQYDLVAFTDDTCVDGDAYISGSVTEGDYNAISSDAVAKKLTGIGNTGGIRLTTSDDLNDIYINGFYSFKSTELPVHAPATLDASMLVISMNSVELKQICYGVNSAYKDVTFERTAYWVSPGDTRVWTDWYRTDNKYYETANCTIDTTQAVSTSKVSYAKQGKVVIVTCAPVMSTTATGTNNCVACAAGSLPIPSTAGNGHWHNTLHSGGGTPNGNTALAWIGEDGSLHLEANSTNGAFYGEIIYMAK